MKTKSKKYTGVYLYKGSDGDTTYYINFRKGGKLTWIKIGKHSEGVREIHAHKERGKYIAEVLQLDTSIHISLNEGYELFRRWMEVQGRISIKSDDKRWRKHLSPYLGEINMDALTKQMVNSLLLNEWAYLGNNSKFQLVILLKRIYNRLIKEELYMGKNPLIGLENPRREIKKRQRILNIEESWKLLDILEKYDINQYAISKISLLTGMRLSEILRLKPIDVNWERKILNVQTKSISGTGERPVYLCQAVVSLLEEAKEDPYKPFFKKFNRWLFEKAVEVAGLNQGVPIGWDGIKWRVTFHTLRHTFATWNAEYGLSTSKLKELMGHKDAKTTDIYTHLSSNTLNGAVEDLAKKFEDGKPKDSHLKLINS